MVVPAMQHQRRDTDHWQQVAYIDVIASGPNPDCDFAFGRVLLQLCEGLDLIGSTVRQIGRAVHAHEYGSLLAPSLFQQRRHRVAHLAFIRRSAFITSQAESTMKDELGYAVRMSNSVCDSDGCSLRHSKQHVALEIPRFDDSIKIALKAIKGNVRDVSIRE